VDLRATVFRLFDLTVFLAVVFEAVDFLLFLDFCGVLACVSPGKALPTIKTRRIGRIGVVKTRKIFLIFCPFLDPLTISDSFIRRLRYGYFWGNQHASAVRFLGPREASA